MMYYVVSDSQFVLSDMFSDLNFMNFSHPIL